MRVTDLRAEYTTDLIGTQVRHPRLSWRIEGAGAQHSYRIRAAASPAALDAAELIWDSGTVIGRASFDMDTYKLLKAHLAKGKVTLRPL